MRSYAKVYLRNEEVTIGHDSAAFTRSIQTWDANSGTQVLAAIKPSKPALINAYNTLSRFCYSSYGAIQFSPYPAGTDTKIWIWVEGALVREIPDVFVDGDIDFPGLFPVFAAHLQKIEYSGHPRN